MSPVAARRGARWGDGRYLAAYRRLLERHRRLIRRLAIGGSAVAGLFLVAFFGLWWRLSSGPIQLDVVTPWLAAAVEENFGSQHHIDIGGTQIERTATGAAVRIRDIVVRDLEGTVVASAPKAEVRVSAMSLLSGRMRAESLNLVGAELAVRIERDGNVTVFAGANKHPLAKTTVPAAANAVRPASPVIPPITTAPAATAPAITPRPPVTDAAAPPHRASDIFTALLSWIDGIGESGLDGHDLRELGLKNGNLTVDDERTGKHFSFQDITVSLERPHGGGVVVTVGSDNPQRPWGVSAAIKPDGSGSRSIDLEGRHVSISDLLLASRLDDGSVQTNVPVSASLHGEIGPDGVPKSLSGRIVADAGFISSDGGADGRLDIDRAEFKLNWDPASHSMAVPFQILSGGNRITLIAQVEVPDQPGGVWSFKIGGGTVVLAQADAPTDALILNRIAVSARFDPTKRRFVLDRGDLANADVGFAMSGNADYSSGELRVAAGFAGTRMSVDALKRVWPVFVEPKVRDWFLEHLSGGTIERMTIAVNAPFETLKASGPPLPDDGLSLEAVATNCVVHPVAGLPPLRDADLNVHIVGRDAVITLNKATADLPSGRKLTMSAGQFEVPDTAPHEPPARVHFKLDGPVAAAVELLGMDRLRDSAAGVPFDPATTRGTMSAQVQLGMPLKPDLAPGTTAYSIAVDATNFSADRMIMGQRVDAALLKVAANNQGFLIKGDVKIGGSPANLEYRKARTDNDAEIKIQGMLDATARGNLGLDPGNSIGGNVPIRLSGKVGAGTEHDGRFAIEADLTPAQIDGFLPGWVKPAGKPARATFNVITKPQSVRIEDLVIEGSGGGVKGTVDMDGAGELQSASFPAYGFSDGDKTNLKVDRMPDGALRVVMRGEVYDGRGFIKTLTGGPPGGTANKRPIDVDLDMKLGAVVGYNGEALRSLDLKMSRRAGEIRSLGLSAKIGRDAPLSGDLRGRGSGRQVVTLQSGDGGALFRFTDIYSRMTNGKVLITMDPPSPDPTAPQQGTLLVQDFAVHDEAQLQRAVTSNGVEAQHNVMDFSSMRINFNRSAGRVALRDGVVRGPLLGATIDGIVDYARDDVHLRGTLVPLYGPNNLLGQLPILGLFLGGEKEGLLGITYEVVGKPGNPVMHINPISGLAPGLLRKVFEFPANAAEQQEELQQQQQQQPPLQSDNNQ